MDTYTAYRIVRAQNLALLADEIFEEVINLVGVDYYKHCAAQCSPLEFIMMAGASETAH
jgi:hypothetical protein